MEFHARWLKTCVVT